MDGFKFPPIFYGPPFACTPENGIIYPSSYKQDLIAHIVIPPATIATNNQQVSNIESFYTKSSIKCIACDPDWSATRLFATICENGSVNVYDLNIKLIISQHFGHVQFLKRHIPNFTLPVPIQYPATICFTRNRQIISNIADTFVKYCPVSCTYTEFSINTLFQRNPITIMTASPYNEQLLAAGNLRGLISIIHIGEKKVLYRMRGHDMEITSLDWMSVLVRDIKDDGFKLGGGVTRRRNLEESSVIPSTTPLPLTQPLMQVVEEEKEQPRPKLKASIKESSSQICSIRGKPVPIVDSTDVFDIYDFDDGNDEFGCSIRPIEQVNQSQMILRPESPIESLKKLHDDDLNETFDFMEACQVLKEVILDKNKSEEEDEEEPLKSPKLDSYEEINTDKEVELINLDESIIPTATVDESDKNTNEIPSTTATTTELSVDSDTCSIGAASINLIDFNETLDVRDIIQEDNVNETLSLLSEDVNTDDNNDDKLKKSVIFLSSTSKEPCVWIWNTETGEAIQKIELKRSQRPRSICATWINQNLLITNSPSGDLIFHKISLTSTNRFLIKQMQNPLPADKINNVNVIIKGPINPKDQSICIWLKTSMFVIACIKINNTSANVENQFEIIAYYNTIARSMLTIQECPHDLNKIAVGGANVRIFIFNLSNLRGNNVELVKFAQRIQAKILCIVWHPEHENILAFSTEEGRIGIYDVTKTSNVPILMKPFASTSVYQISWANVENPETGVKRYCLFACTKGKLVYFPESGDSKYSAISMKEEVAISAVSAGEHYLALGSEDGYIFLYKLNLKDIVWSQKICTKYISECGWSKVKPSKLAVSLSHKSIHLFDCKSDNETIILGELKGHTGTTFVKWSNENENRLVSTGFDGTVRVWDTEKLECISLYQFKAIMTCALFLPTDERYIMAIGHTETVHIFEISKHMHKVVKTVPKQKYCIENVQIGKSIETDTNKLVAEEKRKNRKIEKRTLGKGLTTVSSDEAGGVLVESITNPNNLIIGNEMTNVFNEQMAKITNSINEIKLEPQSLNDGRIIDLHQPPRNVLRFNYTSICHLINKEFNKEPIQCLLDLTGKSEPENAEPQKVEPQKVEPEHVESENMKPEKQEINQEIDDPTIKSSLSPPIQPKIKTLHNQLFSTRENVRELLEKELKNHRNSNTDSIAHILIPQLCVNLKEDIDEKIRKKILTERDIAIAPMISYDFWRQCCRSFAKQNIELGCPLLAIPYLLSVHDINEAILTLQTNNYYREAWILAKLHKESDDDCFKRISNKWIEYLESQGQLDGAALIAASVGQYGLAVEILEKRRNPPVEFELIIQRLKTMKVDEK